MRKMSCLEFGSACKLYPVGMFGTWEKFKSKIRKTKIDSRIKQNLREAESVECEQKAMREQKL